MSFRLPTPLTPPQLPRQIAAGPVSVRTTRSSSRLTGLALLASLGLGVVAPLQLLPAPAVAQTAPSDLRAVRELIEDENWYDAFSKIGQIIAIQQVDDPARPETWFRLGQTLFALGLYQSALRAFDQVVVPVDHPLFKDRTRYFLRIQRAVPGDLATVERLTDAPESVHAKEDLDEVRFLLGRYYYNVGDRKKAIGNLLPIKPNAGELYLKARHLLGVIYTVENQAQPALDSWKDMLRFRETMGTPAYYAQYENLASMSLGRLFYSTGSFDTAGRYYDRVTEGTSAWLDSLFELGWTYFQLGRIDRVLGVLHTLNSPYFEDRYYPEARVLQALILFRTCRFGETLVSVQKFLRDYKPLKKELDLQLGGNRSDAEFYEYLAALSADKDKLSVQLRRIFNAALNDKRVQRAFAAVVQANQEYAGLEKLERNTTATAFAAQLKEDMGRVRSVMIAEAGGLAKTRLAQVRENLTEVIRQGLRIKYETMKARRGSISDQVRVDLAETARAVSEPRTEDAEHVVWPFDGTYWKDELGGYTYDTRSKCTDKELPRGGAAAARPVVEEAPASK